MLTQWQKHFLFGGFETLLLYGLENIVSKNVPKRYMKTNMNL